LVAGGVAAADHGAGTLAVRARLEPLLGNERENTVVVEWEEMGEFELHP